MPVLFKFDIFLSYSSQDRTAVRRLARRLKADGLRIWFDEWEVSPGDLITQRIEEGLDASRTLVIALSRNASGSGWVSVESGAFQIRFPNLKRRRVIPLRLDDSPIPTRLVPYSYVDWRTRKNAEYLKLLTACRPRGKTLPVRRYRVVVVEDHPIVRIGVVQLFNDQPHLQVVGETGNAIKAHELVKKNNPDLVILDITLEKGNGLELVRQLRAEKPTLPILVISMHEETLYAERALRAGASGYVMKKEPSGKVLRAIDRVLKGEIYLSDRMEEKINGINPKQGINDTSPLDHLSDRELEVFQLLGNGFATRQIAEQLNLSVKTIESYRENLKLKFNVKTGAELILYAIQWMKSEPAI